MERILTEVSNGPHCASVLSQRFGFLAFALWAFNAPFPGTSPAPPSPPVWEPCNIKLIAPLDALEPGPQGVGGAANHSLGGAGTLGAQEGGGGGQEPR